MLLHLDKADMPMKIVYLLSEKLKIHSELIAKAQGLTRNLAKPLLGLKGTHGLYGSVEWWENIEQRKMPLLFVSGIIRRAYVVGMDGGNENNEIELIMGDGSVRTEGIYVNHKADIAMFRVGCRVEFVYVQDEMKKQPAPDGGIYYSDVMLEMAVSLEPVTAN